MSYTPNKFSYEKGLLSFVVLRIKEGFKTIIYVI